MNKVHGNGRIYWIIRDFVDLRTPLMCMGFMKETDYPWRHGKGVQIRTSKYTLQIGLCKRLKVTTETDGILQAIGGRDMDTPAREIGMW
jgi:hypothetical protein